ncbi:MAG: hypothetical protein COC01_07230 [Bacteroidetes bacterium]|nr:MAG: hypothetical protein COC01_07230 [Bacteroidota bacterium]
MIVHLHSGCSLIMKYRMNHEKKYWAWDFSESCKVNFIYTKDSLVVNSYISFVDKYWNYYSYCDSASFLIISDTVKSALSDLLKKNEIKLNPVAIYLEPIDTQNNRFYKLTPKIKCKIIDEPVEKLGLGRIPRKFKKYNVIQAQYQEKTYLLLSFNIMNNDLLPVNRMNSRHFTKAVYRAY